jgi:hypothetical protein
MELLLPLIGKKITIFSLQGAGQERQDVGVLEAAQGEFVQIRKSDHEVLFFSINQIRLIKPFEPL